MSNTNNSNFIVAAISTGATVTTGAASGNITLPAASGAAPRFIRVAATTESYIRLGAVGVVATTSDLMVQPADSVILAIPNGVTNIAYIQGTSAGKVSIDPISCRLVHCLKNIGKIIYKVLFGNKVRMML